MRQDYTIAREKNAMFGSGILKVYFDAFSSKKRRGTTPANIYEQFCYADFVHFSFTGKEKDEETGYGYFGARYMDHELMTMWLSVDPLSDKYPSLSPYNYCAWNPVKLVDPDGREIGDYYNFNGVYLGWDGNYDDKVYIVNDSKEKYKKDASGRIDPKSVSPVITTTYRALEAVQGVYNRTIDNNGIYEESAFVIGGDLHSEIVKGSRGGYDKNGEPYCMAPNLTDEQKPLSGLGLISVHSHPFEIVYGILGNSYRTSVPSSEDKELFKSCSMNIIVGYLSNITTPSEAYPETQENIGATFYSSSFEKIGSVMMSSINKIVSNKQNAKEQRIKNMIKGL